MMTAPTIEQPHVRDDTPDPGIRPTRGVAIGGAVALMVAVILVIVFVGYVPVPSLPSLTDAPDDAIAGQIAYATVDNGDSCIVVARASGSSRQELGCVSNWIESVSWTTDGTVASWVYDEIGPAVTVFDPASGDVIETIAMPGRQVPEPMIPERDSSERADGARAVTTTGARDEGAQLVMVEPDGTRVTLMDLDGPNDYALRTPQWSPDGNWILVNDSTGRLIIVAPDGDDPNPRVLADDATEDSWTQIASWWIDGHEGDLVDLAELR